MSTHAAWIRIVAISTISVSISVECVPGARGDDQPAGKSSEPAVAWILVSRTRPSLLSEPAFDPAEFAIYKQTQAASVSMPAVVNQAIINARLLQTLKDDPAAGANLGDPVAWITRQLKVDFPGDAELMRVTFGTGAPETQSRIVNAVVRSYFELVVEGERLERQTRREAIKAKCDFNLQKLTELMQQIRVECEKAGVTPNGQVPFFGRQLQLEATERKKAGIEMSLRAAQIAGKAQQETEGSAERTALKKAAAALAVEAEALQTRFNEVIAEAERYGQTTPLIDRLQLQAEAQRATCVRLLELVETLTIELDAPSRVRHWMGDAAALK